MPKYGIVHDYDSMANQEEGARNQECEVCGDSPMSFLWSDYAGEAMCLSCGSPYQLKWGSDEMREEGDYPYLTLADRWVPVVREYHEETGAMAPLGTFGGMPDAIRGPYKRFVWWVEKNHPEIANTSPNP